MGRNGLLSREGTERRTRSRAVRWLFINDGKCITTMHLLDTIRMNTVSGALGSMLSSYRGEVFQHWNVSFFLSVTLSESLLLLHASPDTACILAAALE